MELPEEPLLELDDAEDDPLELDDPELLPLELEDPDDELLLEGDPLELEDPELLPLELEEPDDELLLDDDAELLLELPVELELLLLELEEPDEELLSDDELPELEKLLPLELDELEEELLDELELDEPLLPDDPEELLLEPDPESAGKKSAPATLNFFAPAREPPSLPFPKMLFMCFKSLPVHQVKFPADYLKAQPYFSFVNTRYAQNPI